MKKIILYNDAQNVGGHEILAVKMAEYLSSKEFEVHFVISKEAKQLENLLNLSKNIKVIKIDSLNSRFQIVKNFFDVRKFIRLYKLLKKINPEFLIAVQGNIEASSSILFPAKFFRIPVITYIPLAYKLRNIYKNNLIYNVKDFINNLYFKLPDFFITINSGMCEKILDRGVDKDKVFIVKNALDFKKYKIYDTIFAKEELGLPTDKKIFGLIGRIEFQHKGQDLLLKMIEKYKMEFEDSIFLIIGDGADLIKMKSIIFQKKMDKYFIFIGHISEMSLVYSAIDYGLITSRYEAFERTPLVLYETLYFGKKVFSSAIDGIKDFLPLEWTFELENVEDMKNCLIQTNNRISDSNEIEKIRDMIINTFTLNEFEESFYNQIKKIEREINENK